MENCYFPQTVQEYLQELIRRNTVSEDSINDKTLMNYLNTQRFDKDYLKTTKLEAIK